MHVRQCSLLTPLAPLFLWMATRASLSTAAVHVSGDGGVRRGHAAVRTSGSSEGTVVLSSGAAFSVAPGGVHTSSQSTPHVLYTRLAQPLLAAAKGGEGEGSSACPLLVAWGAHGSGKSELLFSGAAGDGLLPRLMDEALAQGGDGTQLALSFCYVRDEVVVDLLGKRANLQVRHSPTKRYVAPCPPARLRAKT